RPLKLGNGSFNELGVTFPVRPAIVNDLFGEARTIGGILHRRAEEHPSETAFPYLPDPTTVSPTSLTYEELTRRASRIASRLSREGLRGERVLLLFPAGREFVEAFF